MSGILSILSPQRNWTVMSELGRILAGRRQLLGALVAREIKDANVRSVMGSFWVVGAPLLTMMVYIFAFTFIFRMRLGLSNSPWPYTGYVLVGLAVWISLQEAASRAPNAILGNANLVKQIVFPIELLPLKVALAAQTTFLVTLAVAAAACAYAGDLTWDSLWLTPLAMLAFLITSIGLSYFIAALAVFFPDIRNLINLFFSAGLFLHPILYPPDAPPASVSGAFAFSPLSHLVWCFRDALFLGHMTRPLSWAVAYAFAIFMFLFGYRFFRMLKPTFGNAL